LAQAMSQMGRDHSKFTIVLPTYNEVENISDMVRTLFGSYPGVRVRIMDDGSKDGTVESVRTLQAQFPALELVQRDPADRGLTAALMEGIAGARTDLYIAMDSDFQHPPMYVADMMEALMKGPDLAVGCRRNKGPLGFTRRLGSVGAHKLAATYLWFKRKPRSRDLMSGFFGGKTEVSRQIIEGKGKKFERKGFKVLFDLLKFSPPGMTLVEVDFDFADRAGGKSKLSSDVLLSVLKQCGFGGRAAGFSLQFFLVNRAGRVLGLLMLAAIFALAMTIGTGPHAP
jgi:dolichol-phosphate mannosyltransferase